MFQQRKSPNKLKVKMIIGAKPWLADPKHVLYEAGKRAVKRGQIHIVTSSRDDITSCLHVSLLTRLSMMKLHCSFQIVTLMSD